MGVGSGTAHPQGMRCSGPDAAPPSIADLVSTATTVASRLARIALWITVCPAPSAANVVSATPPRVLSTPWRVVVARVRKLQGSPFPMQDAILAVEVVSPSSGLRDRETKRALYAETGIPSYWLVEPDEERPTIRLTEFALGPDKTYVRVVHRVTGVFRTEAPWPLEIDLTALSARRASLLDGAEDDA